VDEENAKRELVKNLRKMADDVEAGRMEFNLLVCVHSLLGDDKVNITASSIGESKDALMVFNAAQQLNFECLEFTNDIFESIMYGVMGEAEEDSEKKKTIHLRSCPKCGNFYNCMGGQYALCEECR
jgi:hypothetical protein